MPLLGTRGAASAKAFGFTNNARTLGILPWVYTQTNASIGNSTVNYGKDFGSNSVPKGTLVQYNGIQGTATTSGIWIPQVGYWKPYYLNYFVIGTAQPNLTNVGWTNNLYTGNSGNNTSLFNALLSTRDIEYGSYVGNGVSGRTIPHSLQTWAGVVMCMSDGYWTGGFRYDRSGNQVAVYEGNDLNNSFFGSSAATILTTVSTWSTETSFKVTDSCNVNGRTYYYVAYANQGETVYCGNYNVDAGERLQNIGFTAGSIVTKGSNGGNYSWHNPDPIANNSNSGQWYYNGFWDESGSNGQATSVGSWAMSSTGFTAPTDGNGWYGTGAGRVYYWAVKKTS